MGMVYLISYIPPAFYFDKKQSLAMGIVSAGGGMSTLCFPLLSEWLIDVYSWRGALLITSGLLLNCLPCYILIRPVNERKKLLPQKGILTHSGQHNKSILTDIVKLEDFDEGNCKDDVIVKAHDLSGDSSKSKNMHNGPHKNISNKDISNTVPELVNKLQNETSLGNLITTNKINSCEDQKPESSQSLCEYSVSESPKWKKPLHQKWQRTSGLY